jgi:type IV secretion system protein TrbL
MTGTYPMFGLTWILMMLSYAALAINAFMVMIEYYLAIAVVGILLPFGVISPTRWIAMKPASYFLSCGLKMMVIAFLIAIGRTVMKKVHFSSDEPTLREMWIAICCTGMIGLLCWKAPDRLAQGFMAGAASLGGGDVGRHVQAVGAGTARTAGAVAGATVAAGKALHSGYQWLQGHLPAPSHAAASKGPASGGGGSGSATGFIASAAGRPGAAPKPPVLVPPSDTPAAPQKE